MLWEIFQSQVNISNQFESHKYMFVQVGVNIEKN